MQTETNQPTTANPREYQDKVFALLNKWARQRPGLEFCNYGDVPAYRSELRSITKTLADFNALMASAAWRTFTPAQIREAFRAYSGRLSLVEKDGQPVSLEYCTGQYWPTEYRNAACAVLAMLLWNVKLDNMPSVLRGHGDSIRAEFRREFGPGVAKRWFN